jgi:putative signal transducing protein
LTEHAARDRAREPLIKLAVAENPATAEFIEQILAGEGIRCLIKNTDPVGVMSGSVWTSPFAVHVLVLQGDEPAAQRALAAAGFDTGSTIALPSARRYKRRR